MKTILVTGGESCLGKNFIELYKKKFDIVAPAETNYAEYEEVQALFASNKFDAVLHLYAAPEGERGTDNLICFKTVQHACLVHGVKKLLYVSDAADLDSSRALVCVREEAFGECVPQSGYGMARYLSTLLAQKDSITTVFRLFDLYGKYAAAADNVDARILSAAVTGKKELALSCNRIQSTIYAEDACKILAAFINKDIEKGVYNLTSTAPVSLFDFAKKAKAYAKKDDRVLTLTLGKEVMPEYTANNDKLLGALGGFKFTALSTGITKTLDFYKRNKSYCK